MANKNLFKSASTSKKVAPAANTVNHAGGVAFTLEDKAALAQLAVTGTFNSTYYVSEKEQLDQVLSLARKVDTDFLAKLAVYSRQRGMMKDMPAILLAVLATRDTAKLSKVFNKVVDNPKMLRNFVQIMRSGVVGRKSLGTRPKKLVQAWLNRASEEQLFRADVGNDPSLQDIIKLTHPKPNTEKQAAMFSYLLDSQKGYNAELLPEVVKQYEAFKKSVNSQSNDVEIPNVPFQMLTSLPLTNDHWSSIAKNATWNQARMNLNTFLRHSVFNDQNMVDVLSDKLQNSEEIKRSKVFPYQLFSAFMNVNDDVPTKLKVALQKAADISLENIPEYKGKVYVMVDVSGSMNSPITGYRGGVSSKMTCVSVAALIASAILKKNTNTVVMPFDTRVHSSTDINPLDSVMTNANKLSRFGGGGTDCSLPLRQLNSKNAEADLVIYVSDNESWVDRGGYGNTTGMMAEWKKFKVKNKKAKLVCIDLTPNTTSQVSKDPDILRVGGFSDQVFDVISKFVESGNDPEFWVKQIESFEV